MKPEIQNVSGTAFISAAFRAEGGRGPDALYQDGVTPFFLNDEIRKRAEQVARPFPPAKDMIQVRTRYFDEVMGGEIAAGCRQVVILGSGLDARAARLNGPGVAYFEIDHPATLRFKENTLRENGVRANVTYIPGDYVRDGPDVLLSRSGLDPALPVYFLWEGNTTYLKRETVLDLLARLRRSFRGFKISLDYMAEKVITRSTGHDDINDYIAQFEAMGAPWKSGFDDIRAEAGALDLKVIENFSTAELHQKYRPGRPLRSNLFKFYFVCTLEAHR